MMKHTYNGARLGEILKEQGRTQRWLARRIGVSDALLSLVISGQRTFTPEAAEKVAQTLNLPLFFLADSLPVGRISDAPMEEAEPCPARTAA